MDQSAQYGQMEFNLPHDVVKLPSKGIFYKPQKASLKVGYLTANDENLLMAQNVPKEGLVYALLKSKIYEPGFDIQQLIDVDIQAILLFLRNTAFGTEYNIDAIDPITKKPFEVTINLDEVNYSESKHIPDTMGLFELLLPKTNKKVKCKLLSMREENELDEIIKQYPKGMVAPVVTKKLEKHIVELDGKTDKVEISKFVNSMPIIDSKFIRKFLKECEPKINFTNKIQAPSGEEIPVDVSFGAEFFRPFFSV